MAHVAPDVGVAQQRDGLQHDAASNIESNNDGNEANDGSGSTRPLKEEKTTTRPKQKLMTSSRALE